MTIALHAPSLPQTPLEQCSNAQRKIVGAGPCWDLKAAQTNVSGGVLRFAASPRAGQDLSVELRWDLSVVKGFFLSLDSHHYKDSEWVVPPPQGIPADAYLMGFSKFNLARHPNPGNVYFKFSVREKSGVIFVHSCHPARY